MPSSACKKSARSEEHTSELQSHDNLVCRLLLAKNRSSAQGKRSGARRSFRADLEGVCAWAGLACRRRRRKPCELLASLSFCKVLWPRAELGISRGDQYR